MRIFIFMLFNDTTWYLQRYYCNIDIKVTENKERATEREISSCRNMLNWASNSSGSLHFCDSPILCGWPEKALNLLQLPAMKDWYDELCDQYSKKGGKKALSQKTVPLYKMLSLLLIRNLPHQPCSLLATTATGTMYNHHCSTLSNYCHHLSFNCCDIQMYIFSADV